MPKIALGTVQFGVNYGISSINGQVSSREVRDILSYADSQKIDLLDTAPAYGNSEQVLGETNVQNFKIVTKTRHFYRAKIGSNELRLMKKDFNKSLENLNQDFIHGLLVHNADDLLKPGSQKLFDQLLRLKKTGKVKKIGVSVYESKHLQSILENFDIDIVQLPFNIFDKRLIDNGMFFMLQNRGIEIHARSVFLQGLLLMTKQDRPNKFKYWSSLWKAWDEWLNDNQITSLEASIRYALSVPELSKVLVGVNTVKQLKGILTASSGDLPKIPSELFIDDVNLLNPSNWSKL